MTEFTLEVNAFPDLSLVAKEQEIIQGMQCSECNNKGHQILMKEVLPATEFSAGLPIGGDKFHLRCYICNHEASISIKFKKT